MANCGSCGAYVPDEQPYCSMCMGDPYYGSDGYYLAELARAEEQAGEDQEYNDMMENLQNDGGQNG